MDLSEKKRPMSECALPPTKRICSTQCLHCKSLFHTWAKCTAGCVHCSEAHPRRRCPALPLALYLPGGFTILNGNKQIPNPMSVTAPLEIKQEHGLPDLPPLSTFSVAPTTDMTAPCAPFAQSGISMERVAMIANTPEAPTPSYQEPVGPRRTQANTLPLGKPNRMGSQKHTMGHQKHTMGQTYEAEDVKTWQALCEFVYSTVRSARNINKSSNNGRDAAAVDGQVRAALDVLKPTILRSRK